MALDFSLGPSCEVVVVGDRRSDDTNTMLRALQRVFLPNKVVISRPVDVEQPPITQYAAFTRELPSHGGQATANVCHNYHCSLPPTNIPEMLQLLEAT